MNEMSDFIFGVRFLILAPSVHLQSVIGTIFRLSYRIGVIIRGEIGIGGGLSLPGDVAATFWVDGGGD